MMAWYEASDEKKEGVILQAKNIQHHQ